jgi:hypothetical protein
LKVPAEINAVTSKSKTTIASGNSKNKVVNNSKVEAFSGYLKDYEVSAKEDSTPTSQKSTQRVRPKLMDFNEAHQKFGHISERMLKITAQRDNLVLTGKLLTCSACLLYKASQRPVKKDTLLKATYAGERIHMDVSGSFPPTVGGHRYWVMFKDQYSGMAWNVFTPNKDKVYEITKEKIYYFAGLKK